VFEKKVSGSGQDCFTALDRFPLSPQFCGGF
jgi:hypothetical protein